MKAAGAEPRMTDHPRHDVEDEDEDDDEAVKEEEIIQPNGKVEGT